MKVLAINNLLDLESEKNAVDCRDAIEYILNQWDTDTIIIQREDGADSPRLRSYTYWAKGITKFDSEDEDAYFMGMGSIELVGGVCRYLDVSTAKLFKHLDIEDQVCIETNKLSLKFKISAKSLMVLSRLDDSFTLGCYRSLNSLHALKPTWIITV